MHSLLQRQLTKNFEDPSGLPEEWQGFLDAVNAAYQEFDDDREMLERSLELSSQELLQANAEMRAVFQAIPDLLFRLDRDGLILDYQTGVATEFYLQLEKLLGKRIQDVLLNQTGDIFREALQHVRQTDSMISIEYSLIMGGRKNYYEARLSPLLENQIVAIIRNVTEPKRVDEEREALIVELEAKNAELERFTYTVSHDLKSPLITIRGFLGFLEKAALEGNTEAVKADMVRIINATDKMELLLNELLKLSRIGRLMNPPEDVSFGDLTREAMKLVSGRLIEKCVEVEIAPDLPVVYGDRLRLREVLQNLLDNALKFMVDQPQPRIEVGLRHDGDEPVFYVRDNGIGIDPRFHYKVFGLFKKLDSQAEGTGVGLAIVKRIIEVHGGRIWVESEGEGKDTTFCFTLPKLRAET